MRADLWSQGTDVYETRIVHGPLRGPGPWTTLSFEDEILPGSKRILGTLNGRNFDNLY